MVSVQVLEYAVPKCSTANIGTSNTLDASSVQCRDRAQKLRIQQILVNSLTIVNLLKNSKQLDILNGNRSNMSHKN